MKNDSADVALELQIFATRLIRIARSTHKEHALSSAQYSAMALLMEQPGISVVELARRENVAHPTISRLIAGLIKLGLVERVPDPKDRRSGLLSLTESGAKLYREVAERRIALFRAITAQLSPATLSEVIEVTRRLAGPLELAFRNA